MNEPLSPAAQAVLDAVEDHGKFVYRNLAAAALEAVANQVDWESGDPKFLVLAIAAELKQ